MSPRISIFDTAGLDRLRQQMQLDTRQVRNVRNNLFKRFQSDDVALARFSASDRIDTHVLELVTRCDSQIDGASKLVLRTRGGKQIEAVLLRVASGRTTLCVSSQAGCAAACEFCATGNMGFVRNLTADEILDQVLIAGQLLATEKRSIGNIVFMGMGEPFHNEDSLYRAIELLIAPELFHQSPSRIVVSTVGITDAMLRCAGRFPSVKLALSLHSVRQEVREMLMPIAKKYPLDQLRATIVELNRRSRSAVMIEYLMLSGVNDCLEDASQLISWLAGLRVHVNLIPYNPIADRPSLASTDRCGREAFANELKAAGIKTTIRYSLGQDIAAACGQLANQEPSGTRT